MAKVSKFGLMILILAVTFGFFEASRPDPEAQEPLNPGPEELASRLLTIQNNSLVANSSLPSLKVIRKVSVMTTAYSSTLWETDDDPHTTAAGTKTREGIIANNMLPFGTKVRMPELYGDKIFVVEDRMSWKKGNYHIDIWFPSNQEAKNFGAKITQLEILES